MSSNYVYKKKYESSIVTTGFKTENRPNLLLHDKIPHSNQVIMSRLLGAIDID